MKRATLALLAAWLAIPIAATAEELDFSAWTKEVEKNKQSIAEQAKEIAALKAAMTRLEAAIEELTPSGTAKDIRPCFCKDCKCDPCKCKIGGVPPSSPAASHPFGEQSGRQVLFFTADWCPHCPRAKAILQPLIDAGKITVVDCTEEMDAAGKHGVTMLPCLLQVVDGKWRRKAQGADNISLGTGQSFLNESPTLPNGLPTNRVYSPVVPLGNGGFMQPPRFRQSCPGGNCPLYRGAAATQERRDLIAHLTDLNHHHRLPRSQVAGLSTGQLRALHNRLHGGSATVAHGYANAVGF